MITYFSAAIYNYFTYFLAINFYLSFVIVNNNIHIAKMAAHSYSSYIMKCLTIDCSINIICTFLQFVHNEMSHNRLFHKYNMKHRLLLKVYHEG